MIESIWFVLWGLLWAIYFMLDGFDLGVGTLLPILCKTETDRRIMINAVGPFWNGNEVWLITAGGVTFAAFPTTYAVLFSSLYTPMMIILFALILRGVAFEFRGEVNSPGWRSIWDVCIVVGSITPPVLLGVVFANIFRGIPIDAQGVYQGNLLTLLNPYGLMGGILFLLLFLSHGCLWITIKTEGDLQRHAELLVKRLWPFVMGAAVLFLVATGFSTRLYDNYINTSLIIAIPLALIPILAVGGLITTRISMTKQEWVKAWTASAAAIVGTTMFGVVGLYPTMLPSSLDPAYSLTIYNSASSPLTLKIMLGVTLTFIPVVIAYQVWAYRLFKGKVRKEDLTYGEPY